MRSKISQFLRLSAGLALVPCLGSCAGVTVRPVPAAHVDGAGKRVDPDSCERGVRFFQPAPFLLVYSDGKGGLVSEVVYLPDLAQKTAARPYAVLASNKTTLTFANGVLTQQTSTIDETVIPKALAAVIQTAGTAALKLLLNAPQAPGTPGPSFPNPYLYRIVLADGTVELHGRQAVDASGNPAPPIRLTISAPAKAEK